MRKSLFLSYLLIIFILFLSLTSVVFELSGALFVIELLFLGLSILIAAILMKGTYSGKPWVNAVSMIFFSVQLLNLVGMYFSVSFNKVVLPLAVCVIGMFMVFTHASSSKPKVKKYYKKNAGKTASKTTKKSSAKKTKKKTSRKKTTKKKSAKKSSKKSSAKKTKKKTSRKKR